MGILHRSVKSGQWTGGVRSSKIREEKEVGEYVETTRQPQHTTAVVEEILRLHIEEGYSYRQLAEKFQKPFKTIQNMIHNEYKKQRQLLECGKVPRSASTFLNPTNLALQRENRQLRMENELLRGFHRSQEKR